MNKSIIDHLLSGKEFTKIRLVNCKFFEREHKDANLQKTLYYALYHSKQYFSIVCRSENNRIRTCPVAQLGRSPTYGVLHNFDFKQTFQPEK